MDHILANTKKIIPRRIFSAFAPTYHFLLAFLGAAVYGFPSKKIKVVAVTGTKGKSSVTEILNAILEEDGYKTALSNTIRFKVGNISERNLYKMSMPGRFFVQKFLKRAVDAGCDYAVLEVTSQGAELSRHKFIDFVGLIFTNLAPEHIEAHGSYEKYVAAKLSIADAVVKSKRRPTVLVANKDDKEVPKFLAKNFGVKLAFSISDAKPYELFDEGFDFTFHGEKIHSPLSGEFNILNILAAATFAQTQKVPMEKIVRAVEKFSYIPGRVERVKEGQEFDVIVDYAHTPESLQALYDAFGGRRRICVLGNTGGGRDVWKRDLMAKIAEQECDEIILTNEDPYDDDPQKIVEDMAKAIPNAKPTIVMDRREAIAKAISMAHAGDAVLITGKGTDPYIMGPNYKKIPWSDTGVVREELKKIKK